MELLKRLDKRDNKDKEKKGLKMTDFTVDGLHAHEQILFGWVDGKELEGQKGTF